MSPVIPKTQKAAVVPSVGSPIEIKDNHPVKTQDQLAPGECLVKLLCTGVCHTDLHAAAGDWPINAKTPLIGGHEGVGVIVAIGSNTVSSPVKIGDRVGIKWLANSCLDCEQCRKGLEQSKFNRTPPVVPYLCTYRSLFRLPACQVERFHRRRNFFAIRRK
jgi:propanol-preferring alcohol dehydrogenase